MVYTLYHVYCNVIQRSNYKFFCMASIGCSIISLKISNGTTDRHVCTNGIYSLG